MNILIKYFWNFYSIWPFCIVCLFFTSCNPLYYFSVKIKYNFFFIVIEHNLCILLYFHVLNYSYIFTLILNIKPQYDYKPLLTYFQGKYVKFFLVLCLKRSIWIWGFGQFIHFSMGWTAQSETLLGVVLHYIVFEKVNQHLYKWGQNK